MNFQYDTNVLHQVQDNEKISFVNVDSASTAKYQVSLSANDAAILLQIEKENYRLFECSDIENGFTDSNDMDSDHCTPNLFEGELKVEKTIVFRNEILQALGAHEKLFGSH